jgi:hypothetical protein
MTPMSLYLNLALSRTLTSMWDSAILRLLSSWSRRALLSSKSVVSVFTWVWLELRKESLILVIILDKSTVLRETASK